MIGVDIIDLSDPLLKGRTERSLKLISNPKDQLIDHLHIFWILWTAKEAIFKCYRTNESFAPKEIPVQISFEEEKISFKSNEFEGNVTIGTNHIIALAGRNVNETCYALFNQSASDWSSTIRQLLVDFFTRADKSFKVDTDTKGLPILTPYNYQISITHHGNYGAFAYPEKALEKFS